MNDYNIDGYHEQQLDKFLAESDTITDWLDREIPNDDHVHEYKGEYYSDLQEDEFFDYVYGQDGFPDEFLEALGKDNAVERLTAGVSTKKILEILGAKGY